MGRVDDNLPFQDPHIRPLRPWKVLIADDEPEVHDVTRLVLGNFRFADRRLHFLSAHSASHARQLLLEHPDTAVLLLDVVMESEQAGLHLVRSIREELGNPFVRIVLRTGQAGQAPEHDVIAEYDINDYKEKTELTATRLSTTMYAALRAYRDMRTIEANRLGLENVIRASAHVFTHQNSNDFAAAVLSQLILLAGSEHSALYCTVRRQTDGPPRFVVAAGAGRYQAFTGEQADEQLPDAVVRSLQAAYRDQQHQFEHDHYVLHFVDSQRNESLLFVGESAHLSPLDHALFELFCTNVSIAFENLHLSGELLSSQLEMVYMLAGAAETRSQETANHVRRVGLLAEMIGQAMGHDAGWCETLRYAAPLHDIGKIGIPDPILNKPGPHTPEEALVMRTHADIGARLLGNSQKPVLRMAADIARAHHENWDGSGYPLGLSGNDIPIAGRITMVADVFDALGSRRCYKESWEPTDIHAFMLSERGRKFDPAVVDHLFACWEKALELRRQLPD